MLLEKPGFKFVQQMLQGNECKQFVGAEPKAGEGEATVLSVIAVTATFFIVNERRVELIAQIRDQPGQGGARKTM